MNLQNNAVRPSVLGLLVGPVALVALLSLWNPDSDRPSNPAARAKPKSAPSGITPGSASDTTDEPGDSRPSLPTKRGDRSHDKSPPDIVKALSDLGLTLQADRIGKKSAEGSVKLFTSEGPGDFTFAELRASSKGGFVAVGPIELLQENGEKMIVKPKNNGEILRIGPDGSVEVRLSEVGEINGIVIPPGNPDAECR